MYGPQETSRCIDQGVFLLQTFHNEYNRNPQGRETEFWRGNLACWRGMVHDFFRDQAGEIISRVRQSTGLAIPHRGPLSPDGSGYLGWDSGADF
jgi:hypothetical protein